MTAQDVTPLALVAAFGVAAYVHRLMMRGAQPIRLRLAEKGERFLARTDVPAQLRRDVQGLLDGAFPCNCFLLFLVLPFMPIIALYWVLNDEDGRPKEFKHAAKDVRGAYLEIRSLHRKLGLANHPILYPLAQLVMGLSLVVAAPFALARKHATEVDLDTESALLSLEQTHTSLKLALHRRAAA